MVNIVSSISSNLLSADLYSRCTGTALGVYAVAKAKGDSAMMDRAIGYAGGTSASANDAAGKIDDDLREALKAAHAEEEENAQKVLEEKKAEENNKEVDTSESATGDSVSSNTSETVEIDPITKAISYSSYSDNGTMETAVQPITSIDIQV
jgi:hypothetical protein